MADNGTGRTVGGDVGKEDEEEVELTFFDEEDARISFTEVVGTGGNGS